MLTALGDCVLGGSPTLLEQVKLKARLGPVVAEGFPTGIKVRVLLELRSVFDRRLLTLIVDSPERMEVPVSDI